MANSPYAQSGHGSRYGSPASSQWGEAYHGQPQMIQYGPYGSPVPIHSQPHHYGSPPYMHMSRGVSTPPTSSHSQDDGPTNRKGHARATKRKNKPASEKAVVPELEKPLSELTKDLTVPVRDMEAWVNRSAETREVETEKRNGQIARPMNSFMLYRSAYAERTKVWCAQNNHQIVSAVSGKSWPKETPEIREFYNDLAKLERDNHQKAFPGYKFSPSKTNATGQRKRKEADEDDDVLLAGNVDVEYRPSGTRSRPRPSTRSATPDLGGYGDYQFTSAPGPMPYRLQTGAEALNMSHFASSNPGKMAPGHLAQAYDHYYEMHQYPGGQLSGASIQDVRYVPHQHPMMMQHQSVVGLPGGAHAELLDEQDWAGASMADHSIDPLLMGDYDHGFLSQAQMDHAGAFNERSFRDLEGDLAGVRYGGPPSAGANGLMQFGDIRPAETEDEEFERIMNGKS